MDDRRCCTDNVRLYNTSGSCTKLCTARLSEGKPKKLGWELTIGEITKFDVTAAFLRDSKPALRVRIRIHRIRYLLSPRIRIQHEHVSGLECPLFRPKNSGGIFFFTEFMIRNTEFRRNSVKITYRRNTELRNTEFRIPRNSVKIRNSVTLFRRNSGKNSAKFRRNSVSDVLI